MLIGIVVGASPARAAICAYDPDGGGPVPSISFPCPDPTWQEGAPLPVAVVQVYEQPGYGNQWVDFLRVQRGGRIFFVNDDTIPHRFNGAGFDSGVTNPGEMHEVQGISTLAIGKYRIYEGIYGIYAGDLYIDPIPGCAGPDGCA